jgi:uncharacterized damage-inducible protein DinB
MVKEAQENAVVEYLRRWSGSTFEDLLGNLEGLTDRQAWWRVPLGDSGEHMHSSGSVLGIVLHVASCKVMYAEYAFRDGALTWRDMSKRAWKVEPHLDKAIGWLKEAHELWMRSWEGLTDHELSGLRKTNWGEEWPTERIITAMIHHEVYHTGQIRMIRAQLPEDLQDVKPISEADLWDQHLPS